MATSPRPGITSMTASAPSRSAVRNLSLTVARAVLEAEDRGAKTRSVRDDLILAFNRPEDRAASWKATLVASAARVA
jgi:hypothetical protein